MPAREDFQYAIVRVVPRVERGETLNAGVVLFSRRLKFLAARTELDEAALAALSPGCDPEGVRRQLRTIEHVAAGDPAGGPIAELEPSERFHWLDGARQHDRAAVAGPHRADRISGRGAGPAVRAARAPLTVGASFQLPVRWSCRDGQARRRRPAGASAAPVILEPVTRIRVLIAADSSPSDVGATAAARQRAPRRRPRRLKHRPRPRRRRRSPPGPGHTSSASAGSRARFYVTSPPADRTRLFVVEQGGKVKIVRGGRRFAGLFLDVSGAVSTGGEHGLLSLAFAPDYRTSGLLLRATTRLATATSGSSTTSVRAPTTPRRARPATCCPCRSRRPTTTAASCCSGPTSCCTPASATAAAPATSTARAATPEPRHPAREVSASTRGSAAQGVHRPAATRSRTAAARGARSTPTACATRGGSRSRQRPTW